MTTQTGIILDLDGTVYRGNLPIPGSAGAVSELRRRGHPLVFVTNALESPAEHAAKLARCGVTASPDEIITAPLVLMRYLERQMPGATLYPISDPPLVEQLGARFRLSQDPDEIDAVVVSCDQEFDARKLNTGFQALRRGARFLAINADATCPVPGGELPDAGAVIGALEGCSQRKVEMIYGKPSQLMATTLLEQIGLPAHQCWMVGDSLETDIRMGQGAGMTTALVLTGIARREDLERAVVRPDHVLESIIELPRLLSDGSSL
jgi:arabinose operon protein AraL